MSNRPNKQQSDDDLPDLNVLAETENFSVIHSVYEGDDVYDVELSGVTMHLFKEEWVELVALIKMASESA